MAVYEVTKADSPLSVVEFTPVSNGNFSFFHVKDAAQVDGVKQWLTSKEMGQEVVGESQVGSQHVLVTRGPKTMDGLMAAIDEHGDKLKPYEPKIPFREKAWKTGATIALVGQGLQFTSSFLRPDRKADWGLRMLAIPNIIATIIVLIFGAQRSEDTHRLHFLKSKFNDEISKEVPNSVQLPAVDDTRYDSHKDIELPPTPGHRVHEFLKKYSVVFGEIGLRYFGAFAMAFPIDKWKGASKLLQEGAIKEAYNAGKNTSVLTHRAGILSLTGKTVAIGSLAPDPYDPKPESWLDKVREKITFRTGGIIETAAFAMIAIDGFKNKKISFKKIKDLEGNFLPGFSEKNMYRDFISGIGGTLFTIRYIIRYWAPFGVKDTNMNELYAHVTDSLALVPPDKLPNLVAQTAAEITDHFKDRRLEYNDVYTRLMDDLYKYHHIALNNLGEAQCVAKVETPDKAPETTPEVSQKKYTLANPPRRPLERAPLPATSYADKVVQSADSPTLPQGVGV